MDFTTAGLWSGFKKWGKIILWVALGAIVNMLTQLWFSFRPHDVLLHLGSIDFTLTAGMINVVLTGSWNGFIAGFVKWVTTNEQNAKKEAGIN